jgi:hypothetical protein
LAFGVPAAADVALAGAAFAGPAFAVAEAFAFEPSFADAVPGVAAFCFVFVGSSLGAVRVRVVDVATLSSSLYRPPRPVL